VDSRCRQTNAAALWVFAILTRERVNHLAAHEGSRNFSTSVVAHQRTAGRTSRPQGGKSSFSSARLAVLAPGCRRCGHPRGRPSGLENGVAISHTKRGSPAAGLALRANLHLSPGLDREGPDLRDCFCPPHLREESTRDVLSHLRSELPPARSHRLASHRYAAGSPAHCPVAPASHYSQKVTRRRRKERLLSGWSQQPNLRRQAF